SCCHVQLLRWCIFHLSRCPSKLDHSRLPSGKVKCYIGKHVGKNNNYMVWDSADASDQAHYQAYFDIYKPSIQPPGDVPVLIMYVQSAYLKDEPFAKQRERFKAFGQICAEKAGAIAPKAKGPQSSNRPGKRY
ncbi:hypothetical protein, partial [Janthinobacterium sp. PSPC3-1]|uniref:hypothetical protein n=1 Tax=Janthinobacterium sp. PSPC3-1 TaxID=2804653 RepID=UPI003CECE888